MQKIGFLAFDQMDELDFVGPLEVFGMASRFGADCQTLIVAEELKPVRCRHDLDVLPRQTFSNCPELHMLIVPGGLGARTHARENQRILDFIRRQSGTVASVCTGALIIAAAGILKGLPATTHHSSYELLRQYDGVQVREGVRFVLNNRVATSAGVSAGIDLALALTAQTWGTSVAEAVAANLEWQSSAWKDTD
jgi:transcriptional regulator GlxA family with amidase domain